MNSIPPTATPKEVSTATPTEVSTGTPTPIELPPNFVLPTGLAALSLPLLGVNLWLGLALAVFSTFLTIQAATLRLIFTDRDLDIYRGNQLIRRFPYSEWQNWDIFWGYWPTLFYFRETKSLHFLPILFDPDVLRACLEAKNLPTRRSWQ